MESPVIPSPVLKETWSVTKPAVHSRAGLVVSQHHAASRVGARVLADGGNAVDAAIATSAMIGTVEPWMSGLGGGGFMLVHEAASGRVSAVDFGMRAPAALDVKDYPLCDGTDSDLFGWPGVQEERNVNGPLSIAVPGYAAGIGLASEHFGTRPLAELLAPAIESARSGMNVDWFATLKIAAAAPVLSRYAESARTYLPGGFAPCGEWGGPVPRVSLGSLHQSLERLAHAGWRDFYEGELAEAVVADAAEVGSRLNRADLTGYAAHVLEADRLVYRDAEVFTAPGLTAGPTLRDVLARHEAAYAPAAAPDAACYESFADAMLEAYVHRLGALGDADESRAPSCTTHISVVDRDGNSVALTQTLLSVFGSKVMLPSTGILMNNGIMWFDPRPGRANSMAAGARPLSNMCPVIARREGMQLAAGASGGRRIMSAVMQLLCFICDFGMDVEQAVHQPRIDVSGTPEVTAFENMPAEILQALARGRQLRVEPNAVYPALYACPNVVCRDASGQGSGGAFIMSPWAAVAAADGAG